jgi:signal transduction histidine kinase
LPEPNQPNDSAALVALNSAALLIAAERSLEAVLQKIVDLARELVEARYAALGVPGPGGRMARFVTSGMSEDQVSAIGRRPQGLGILGLLLRSPQVLLVADLRLHPAFAGFPPHHPGMTSFLGVSITARDTLVGNLYLTDKLVGGSFSDADAWLVQTLAAHAAVAIENAQLSDRIRRLAVLEERERIAMDLHDGIIQSIYAVGLSLELGRMVVSQNPDEARSHMVAAVKGLDGIIRDIRSYIMDLQPARIQDEPLSEALDRLVREFRANTLVQVTVDAPRVVDEGLADNCRLALFHITQEALANVAKHARASSVSVQVNRFVDRVVLSIQDNGVGFDSNRIGGIPGHGLSNMSIRCRSLGGDLTVTSSPDQGTVVKAVLPTKPATHIPPAVVSFP